MTVQMYDTVTVDTVPPDPPAVAGYVGGSWPTYIGLVRRFPNAKHLSIAVNAGEDAECLDCEPGDATPPQVAAWVRRQQARGVHRPVVYSSVSEMPTVLADLARAGIRREDVRLWTAHYTSRAHLCGPQCDVRFNTTADATQWTDRALGRNLDESLCQDSFFGPVAPVDPQHYDWFYEGPFNVGGRKLNERAVVKEYDRLRRHPLIHRPRLNVLRDALSQLAGRLLTNAERELEQKAGDPFALYHRRWRFWQLRMRAEGRRLA